VAFYFALVRFVERRIVNNTGQIVRKRRVILRVDCQFTLLRKMRQHRSNQLTGGAVPLYEGKQLP